MGRGRRGGRRRYSMSSRCSLLSRDPLGYREATSSLEPQKRVSLSLRTVRIDRYYTPFGHCGKFNDLVDIHQTHKSFITKSEEINRPQNRVDELCCRIFFRFALVERLGGVGHCCAWHVQVPS